LALFSVKVISSGVVFEAQVWLQVWRVGIAAAVALLITQIDRNTPAFVLSERFLAFRRKISAAVAYAFHQLWDGCILLALEVIWFRFYGCTSFHRPRHSPSCSRLYCGNRAGRIAAGMMPSTLRSTEFNCFLPVTADGDCSCFLSYLFFPGEAVKTPGGAFSLASWPQIALLCLP